MLFSDLEKIVEHAKIHVYKDMEVTRFLTDSRKVLSVPGAVFLAISGANNDGHHYLKSVYSAGVRQFIVENESVKLPDDANVLLVKNTILAAQGIVAVHRSQFQIPVVGITGSNGKTIVKEWLAALTESQFQVIKSPKSYNSQVGVPLSVWQISKEHTLGVFEAGISTINEMENLENVIKPSLGIFTNIGSAHANGFKNQEEKILEKLKLFRNSDVLIYCKDYGHLSETIVDQFPENQLLSWSYHQESQVKVNYSNNELTLHFPDSISHSFTPKYKDRSSLENLIHCLVSCYQLGINMNTLQEKIDSLEGVQMRLTLKQATNGCYLIDDTYNNDLSALEVAIDFLIQHSQRVHKTLILSDILQSGLSDQALYQEINKLLKEKKIDRLIGVGKRISKYADCFSLKKEFYESTEHFLKNIVSFSNEMILVKGARSFQLEKIVQLLEIKTHDTVLEVNMEALTHNLYHYRNQLKQDVKLMVMVKALAYGGSYEIANLLQYHKVDYLGVAYVDEGVMLRKNGIHLPIMVMNVSESSFETLKTRELEPEIYSLAQLKSYLKYFEGTDMPAIHLKIETGMNRLGFIPEDLEELKTILLKNKAWMKVAGIFTHLASADNMEHESYSLQQLSHFTEFSNDLINVLGYRPIRHALNTAGVSNFPDYQLDMVRLGIGLYGFDPVYGNQLKVVSTLKTTISQIKRIKKGESVGYGRSFIASKEMTIAIMAIGYADGYRRSLSNGKGKVLINRALVPVVGNVCMDMTMIEVTDISARVGDEVTVFGENPSISLLAEWLETIPYEILTNVGERVKRVFISE